MLRLMAVAAKSVETEQKTAAILYPSRNTSHGPDAIPKEVGIDEFAGWKSLDREWLTRSFRWLSRLQWLPLIWIGGGLAVVILFVLAMPKLGIASDLVTLPATVLFLFAMLGTWYSVRLSSSAEHLTLNEKELRALFRLTWTTRDAMTENPYSVSAILFQPYMKDSLGRWFIRETLARISRIPVQRP